jgi:hypothetical protein
VSPVNSSCASRSTRPSRRRASPTESGCRLSPPSRAAGRCAAARRTRRAG